MEIGSLVTRKKYNNDIIFRVLDIKEKKAILKGEVIRLIADANLSDLRLFNVEEKKTIMLPKIKEEEHVVKGKILHIDGDEYYLKKAIDTYSKYNINAIGYHIKESEIRHHPERNTVLKVLGVEWEEPQHELMRAIPLRKCQAFLLCSDGFWELIEEEQMCSLLKDSENV